MNIIFEYCLCLLLVQSVSWCFSLRNLKDCPNYSPKPTLGDLMNNLESDKVEKMSPQTESNFNFQQRKSAKCQTSNPLEATSGSLHAFFGVWKHPNVSSRQDNIFIANEHKKRIHSPTKSFIL